MSQICWWAKESVTIASILCHAIDRKLKIKTGKALFGDWGQIVTASEMLLCKSIQTHAMDFDTGEAAEAGRVGVLVKAGKSGEHFIGNWR